MRVIAIVLMVVGVSAAAEDAMPSREITVTPAAPTVDDIAAAVGVRIWKLTLDGFAKGEDVDVDLVAGKRDEAGTFREVPLASGKATFRVAGHETVMPIHVSCVVRDHPPVVVVSVLRDGTACVAVDGVSHQAHVEGMDQYDLAYPQPALSEGKVMLLARSVQSDASEHRQIEIDEYVALRIGRNGVPVDGARSDGKGF